jgi:GNAT superfamily N-acetyltransferase
MSITIRPIQSSEAPAVLALWQRGCAEVGAPLSAQNARQVLVNLMRYADHPDARCFVAVADEAVIGFVTCAALRHPIEACVKGAVEELYVLRRPGRAAVQEALVAAAVRALKSLGVVSIHATTGTDRDDAPARALWRRLGWEHGMTIFSIYADVPGDPALQAVWDRYGA